MEDKNRKEGQLKEKEDQLASLDSQIKAKGINPDELEEILKVKEEDLLKKVEDFEQKTEKVGESLKKIQDSLDNL